MQSPMNPWMAIQEQAEDSRLSDVLGGLLVLLMLLVPVIFMGAYLRRLAIGEWQPSFLSVDPMLFRVAGLG